MVSFFKNHGKGATAPGHSRGKTNFFALPPRRCLTVSNCASLWIADRAPSICRPPANPDGLSANANQGDTVAWQFDFRAIAKQLPKIKA